MITGIWGVGGSGGGCLVAGERDEARFSPGHAMALRLALSRRLRWDSCGSGGIALPSLVFAGVPAPWDAKTLAEVTRDLGQAPAWLGAAVFFGYKAWSGYFVVNLSIKVEWVRRSRAGEADDLLQVTPVLAKGDRGSVRLHDVQIRVTPDGGEERVIWLDDFRRLGWVYESQGTLKRGTVEWKEAAARISLLNLTPGEATHFAC